VKPGSKEELASAIERLHDDPALARRLAKAGQERVLSEFTQKRMVEQTLSVYEELAT
jgi:glycosyltransferase involved in cell wall biosynthesis